MKILSIVSSRYAPFYVSQSEILESNGVDITHVYPRKQNPNHDEQKEVTRSFFDYAIVAPRLWSKVLDDYDLVHANNGKMGPFALTQPHRPIVLTLWGADLLGSWKLKTKLTKLSANRSAEVIVRSEEMREELPCDAHVIPAGVDLELFRPMDQREVQVAVNWDPTNKHVLFPYPPSQTKKNYPVAKDLVNCVNDTLSDEVEFQVVTGVDHDQMPLYYNAADVLLLPSDHEGSPNTVKEAMACNLPVVSTNVGDVDKRLTDVKHSFVCDSEKELLDGLEAVLSISERSDGREKVQDMSLNRMAEQIIEVYESATEGDG